MEAGLLSKLPNKTLVMSNKNQFPFSFTCLKTVPALDGISEVRTTSYCLSFSVFLRGRWIVLFTRGVCLLVSYCLLNALVVRCVVAQAEREILLRQSNCSLQPLLPILTQPACIKTVHCAGESPRFSLDSLCGTSRFQSTHMLVGQTIESNALQKISTDKELLCREGPRVYLT